jgi:hypothetical protein
MSNTIDDLVEDNVTLQDIDDALREYFAGEMCDSCLMTEFMIQGLLVVASCKDNPPEINMNKLRKDLHKLADKVLHRHVYSA